MILVLTLTAAWIAFFFHSQHSVIPAWCASGILGPLFLILRRSSDRHFQYIVDSPGPA